MKILKEQYSINESGLSRIWQYTQNGMNFAIIGSQDQDTKKDRSNELRYEIDKLSDKRKNITFRVLKGTYTYEDGSLGEETSYLINNLSKEDAIRIGRKLNQESIIWKDNDFFGFIDMASGNPDGELSKDRKNMSFDKDAIKAFGSRLNSKHNKGQGFVFKMSELVNDNKGSSIKNLGGTKSHEEDIFEMLCAYK